jgi:acetyl-CoA C-acetyltransferase
VAVCGGAEACIDGVGLAGFAGAQVAGHFDAEIVPVPIQGRKGPESFARDEAPRPGTSLEGLSRLRPAFRPDGSITAGNAPGLNSGAAAMVVADQRVAEAKGIAPAVRLVAYGIAAVERGMFGLGPAPAVPCARRWSGPAGGSRTWSASR